MPYQNISWFISSVLFWKTNLSFSVLCAIMKSVEGLVYLLEPCSLWELAISFLDIWCTFLKWDKIFERVCFIYPICSWVVALFTCWTLESILVLIWFFDIIWTTFILCHTLVCLLGWLCVLSKLYLPLALESLVHAYLLNRYILWHALLSLIQYIG